MQVPLYPRRVRVGLALSVATAVLVASVLPPPPGTAQSAAALGPVGADKVAHALAYAALALAVAYARLDRSPRTLALVVIVVAAFGLAIEGVQTTVPARSFELADAAVNGLGATLGAASWRTVDLARGPGGVDDDTGPMADE